MFEADIIQGRRLRLETSVRLRIWLIAHRSLTMQAPSGRPLPAAPGESALPYVLGHRRLQRRDAWVGVSPPWNDDLLASRWTLADWFLEDDPDRMDVDGNGVPCELLFDQEVIAEVWAGNNP